jgi:hypothetical protein
MGELDRPRPSVVGIDDTLSDLSRLLHVCLVHVFVYIFVRVFVHGIVRVVCVLLWVYRSRIDIVAASWFS